MSIELTQYASIEHCDAHVHVEFDIPHQVVSSAVCNGGIVSANHIVNMKVAKNSSPIELPESTILKYSNAHEWSGKVVGMMTAASMQSFRMIKKSAQGVDIIAMVTSGLSNPRRAGDYAECRQMVTGLEDVGTINIVVVTSAKLTEAAMIEALMIITEAKAAALQHAGILSPVSNQLATGTGTDSVAVACGQGPQEVHYCGKHVLFGELLGKAVVEAVSSSIQWKNG